MTKAILVIDMPETCYECKFGDTDRICEMCIAVDRQIHDEEGKFDELNIGKPLLCPLKQIPDKTVYSVFVNNEVIFIEAPEIEESFVNEILGEEDGSR